LIARAARWGVGVGCGPTMKTNGFHTFLYPAYAEAFFDF